MEGCFRGVASAWLGSRKQEMGAVDDVLRFVGSFENGRTRLQYVAPRWLWIWSRTLSQDVGNGSPFSFSFKETSGATWKSGT